MSENYGKQELAFAEWIQRIPKRYLECRVNRHRLPDWSDKRTDIHRYPEGIIMVNTPCLRKCGTMVTTFLDSEGFRIRANRVHYYDPQSEYLIPKDARGPGLTKDRIAQFRKELIERNSEWITEE